MVTVKYEVREDDTERVVDSFERTFADTAERYRWERGQEGHPFLHLKALSATESEAASQPDQTKAG